MLNGQRLQQLREAKKLTQWDIANATGLAQPLISRTEIGHTVPRLVTLEKWARALDTPLYEILHEGENPPEPLKLSTQNNAKLWGHSGQESKELMRLLLLLAKMDEADRKILMETAERMAK